MINAHRTERTGIQLNATTALVGEIGYDTREELRKTLIHSYTRFAVYRDRFDELGLTPADLEKEDPLAVLRRMPTLGGDRFYDLADESIARAGDVIDMETSSGTTGRRKRRVITHRDDASETEFLVRLFRLCGIDACDSVACVDIGPLTLMVSFTRALDELGTGDAYAYCVSPDEEMSIEGLFRLDPSVIVTIPSVLERYLHSLRIRGAADPRWNLSKVIYVGEPLAEPTRAILTGELGLEVFAYYGASETSALGIECRRHDGIHLFNDRNVIEIARTGPDHDVGEVLVTTLRQEGLPLLRYALGDMIEVLSGACPCGLGYPRIEVLGRVDGTASVLGVKVSYDAIREAAYWRIPDDGPIEVLLSNNGRDKMKVVLPRRLAGMERRIRRSLATREPDLAYLVAGRYLELELAFVDDAHFDGSRKGRRIVDRRGGTYGADH